LVFTAATSGVRFIGIEFTRATGTGYTGDILTLGNVGSIDHVIFDRIWCHADNNEDETDFCFSDSAVNTSLLWTAITTISIVSRCRDTVRMRIRFSVESTAQILSPRRPLST
jgi:hypothetical protein